MKRILFAAVLAGAAIPAFAGVGVSVNIGEPGFFGQIDIGDVPAPEYVNAQPIVSGPVVVGAAPIYLHVPPGHIKHWAKHCAAYNACGSPVYFVSDSWYQQRYVPFYRENHGPRMGHGDHRDDRRYDHRGDRHDDRDHGHDRDHHD